MSMMRVRLNDPKGVSRCFQQAIFLISALGSLKAMDLNVLSTSEIDSSALNFSATAASFNQNVNGRSYQRSPLTSFRGYQYATYYDGNRNVCVARRKLPAGAWEVLRFTDYVITNHDSHNVVALGICEGDGTIHVAFDHHKDPLNYRVSSPGVATNPDSVNWSTSLFSSITDELGALGTLTDVTYPSFFSAPDGDLMFYYRKGGSGSGDGMIHEYRGDTGQWTSGMGRFISQSGSYSGVVSSNSTRRNPYLNGISYGGDRLHVSWGWRENSGGTQFNHDLNYAYSDDDGRTWRNSGGSQIGTTNGSAISINSNRIVVAPIPENSRLSNQYTHYAYPDGRCHVILTHQQSGSSTVRYHHYWRSAGGSWSSEVLSFSGSRPKLVGDDHGELFLAYESGNLLRIAKGTPNSSQTAWSWATIHSQSGRSEGGEGHIDTSRWESERVLSVYGQESAASNGAATALGVFDYQVSAKAILPVPADGEMEVDSASSLSWTAGLGAVTHQVYLGTNETSVANAKTSSVEYQGTQAAVGLSPASPLEKGKVYYWRIDEVEPGGVVNKGLIWSFTTASDFILSEDTDASVKENLLPVDQSSETTLLGAGGASPWVDRCTIYVFQLPDLGALAAPFRSANFRFHTSATQGSLKDNDLYGLGRRSSPEVLGTDYYGQTGMADPSDAVRLQSGILTSVTPLGLVNTSLSGSAELLNYLNEQYDSGAGIGEYVFLRLNTAEAKTGINRATLTMSEGSVVTTRPRISYTAGGGLPQIVAGWDHWGSNTAPAASVTGAGIVATATASAATGNWNTTDDNSSGRGSSGDGTWGSFDGGGFPASAVSAGAGSNMTAFNGVPDAEMTFTITNNSAADWELEGFHMDVIAFRPNAPRAYQLEVLSGDVSHGIVFTSADDEINQLSGTLSGSHDDHDEVDLDLSILADSILEPGGTVVLQLSFSSGTGSGGGHHLFVDNIAVSGTTAPMTEFQQWRMEHFGVADDAGVAANTFDADGDGEINLIEFVTNQNPLTGTVYTPVISLESNTLEVGFTRSKSVIEDGIVFELEWSDTLLPGSWSKVGVVETLVGEDSETQSIIAELPAGSLGARFVRFVVTVP